MTYLLFHSVLLLVGLVSLATADILVLTNQGNTPVPLSPNAPVRDQRSGGLSATQETDISMDEEVVRLEEGQYGFRVTCSFRMRSHTDRMLTRTIGFPVTAPRYGTSMAESFKVTVDGKETGTELRMLRKPTWDDEMYGNPAPRDFQYPGYVVWTAAWEPMQTRMITCTYDMGEAEQSYEGLGQRYRLQYVVRTGALWKDSIGEARISVKFVADPRTRKLRGHSGLADAPKGVFIVSYADQAKWTSDREVEWHFRTWKPSEDIVVERALWLGLHDRYFFRLPHPYEGDKKEYSDELLNSFVERELAPWKEVFPHETADFDRKRLKTTIAECLFHEIAARHGDPFILGKVSEKPWPKEATSESSDGFLYGKWRMYFGTYSHHGGWYRPDVKVKGGDNDLNEIERTNRAFLKARCQD